MRVLMAEISVLIRVSTSLKPGMKKNGISVGNVLIGAAFKTIAYFSRLFRHGRRPVLNRPGNALLPPHPLPPQNNSGRHSLVTA